MPKRPSAVTITPDDKFILVGDKFGDVYRIPLLISEDSQLNTSGAIPAAGRFKPSASYSTVHSARNRRALENQLETASKLQLSRKKEPPQFEHELLLGHVSMLTDLAFITVNDDLEHKDLDGKTMRRTYIITADRDEHIRISRGPPQSYVIEGFCCGHKEFVSKLCVLSNNILVSAGGDDHLMIWNWLEGKLLKAISLRNVVQARKTQLSDETPRSEAGSQLNNIAVSGIWCLPKSKTKKVRSLVRSLSLTPRAYTRNLDRCGDSLRAGSSTILCF